MEHRATLFREERQATKPLVQQEPPQRGLTPFSRCQGHTGGSELRQAERLCGFTVSRGGWWVTCPLVSSLPKRGKDTTQIGSGPYLGLKLSLRDVFPSLGDMLLLNGLQLISCSYRTEGCSLRRKWQLRDITTPLERKPPLRLKRGRDGA